MAKIKLIKERVEGVEATAEAEYGNKGYSGSEKSGTGNIYSNSSS